MLKRTLPLWLPSALMFGGILLGGLLSLGASDCGPTPTTATYTHQRQTPFFKILVFEHLKTTGGVGAVQVFLLEDEAGNCYVTSGIDGGVSNAPKSSCEAAKAQSPVEAK